MIWLAIRLRNKETIKGKVHNLFTIGFLRGRIGFTEAGLMSCDHWAFLPDILKSGGIGTRTSNPLAAYFNYIFDFKA